MKKLLKKRFIIPLVVVAALAIAGVAYAAWSNTDSTAAAPMTTGSTSMLLGSDGGPYTGMLPASGPTSVYAVHANGGHGITVGNTTDGGVGPLPITMTAAVTGMTAGIPVPVQVNLNMFDVLVVVKDGSTVVSTTTTTLDKLVSPGLVIDPALAEGSNDSVNITMWLDASAPASPYAGLSGTIQWTFSDSIPVK